MLNVPFTLKVIYYFYTNVYVADIFSLNSEATGMPAAVVLWLRDATADC
jgi:hypothetical protein